MENWSSEDVRNWLLANGFSSKYAKLLCDEHLVDGQVLLMLTESDLKDIGITVLGDLKRISSAIDQLRRDNFPTAYPTNSSCCDDFECSDRCRFLSKSPNGHMCEFKPEIGKAFIAFIYVFAVCFVTSIVMVFAHDRVPNGTDYPPLPDLILENVPYISWAFEGAEVCAMILLVMWWMVLFVHKHRFILFRRQCALAGSIFLLRSVTMMITTLSIPGRHIDCASTRPTADIWSKIERGVRIWTGFGMQLQGVRTCGDYMFSGHTVVLTLLAYFICEYTPRRWHTLHNFTNLLNIFGVFFILAGHEHYSIDVFVAYYISSRVFLYYHSMANSRVLMQLDDLDRTKTWFPLFSYFESQCFGVVPNEYEWPWVSFLKWQSQRHKNSNGSIQYHHSTNSNLHPNKTSPHRRQRIGSHESDGNSPNISYVLRTPKAD